MTNIHSYHQARKFCGFFKISLIYNIQIRGSKFHRFETDSIDNYINFLKFVERNFHG